MNVHLLQFRTSFMNEIDSVYYCVQTHHFRLRQMRPVKQRRRASTLSVVDRTGFHIRHLIEFHNSAINLQREVSDGAVPLAAPATAVEWSLVVGHCVIIIIMAEAKPE